MRLWRKKQPTTPIWIKCRKTGLYELIPYDKMIQFPSGKWGFTAQCFDLATAKFLQNHLDHFQYQHQTNTWVFEPDREDCRPWALRGVSIMGSAALGVNAMMFFATIGDCVDRITVRLASPAFARGISVTAVPLTELHVR